MIPLLAEADLAQGPTTSADDVPLRSSRGRRCIDSSSLRAKRSLAMMVNVVLSEGLNRFGAKRMQFSLLLVSESYLLMWKALLT